MHRAKQVLEAVVQNKPLVEALQVGDGTRVAEGPPPPRTNCVLDNPAGDSQLWPQWQFTLSYGQHAPQPLDLPRMTRDLMGQLPREAHEPLEQLSQAVNAARARIATERANEADFHLYLRFLSVVAQRLENGPAQHRLELPADDDGVNECLAHGVVLTHDSWPVERLATLMRLAALYLGTPSHASTKQQIETHQKAVDCMRELLALARGPWPVLRRYKRPINSLSSDAQGNSGNNTNSRNTLVGPPLDARQFVEQYLGGTASIEAHLHLCEAQRREAIYRDVVERGLEASDGVAAMGAIVEAYTLARTAIEAHSARAKLWHHADFMRQLWLTRANLFVARGLSKQVDRESMVEAVQRVEHNVRMHKARQFDRRSFTHGPLLPQYNTLIGDSNELFRQLDPELGKRFGERPPSHDFVIAPHRFDEKASTLEQAMARDTTCATHLQLLDRLLGGTPVQHTEPAEKQPQTETLRELLEHASDGDSARLGVLVTHRVWIEWILGRVDNGEFIIGEQYTAQLREESQKIASALRRHGYGD